MSIDELWPRRNCGDRLRMGDGTTCQDIQYLLHSYIGKKRMLYATVIAVVLI
jgi:hypothetical protein